MKPWIRNTNTLCVSRDCTEWHGSHGGSRSFIDYAGTGLQLRSLPGQPAGGR